MYSQKWNCYLTYFQNTIKMFCLLVPTLIYLWEIYIFSYLFIFLHILLQGNMWTDPEYINRPQTHERGNWDWGRTFPRKGLHNWDFPCSVCRGGGGWGNRFVTMYMWQWSLLFCLHNNLIIKKLEDKSRPVLNSSSPLFEKVHHFQNIQSTEVQHFFYILIHQHY